MFLNMHLEEEIMLGPSEAPGSLWEEKALFAYSSRSQSDNGVSSKFQLAVNGQAQHCLTWRGSPAGSREPKSSWNASKTCPWPLSLLFSFLLFSRSRFLARFFTLALPHVDIPALVATVPHYPVGVRHSLRRQCSCRFDYNGMSLDIDNKYVFSYKGQSIFEEEISQAVLRKASAQCLHKAHQHHCFSIPWALGHK